ncbi:RecQ family ATP-dependent DNA helicase [Adhaeretor mobilis]|uniref:ATP-dependent DNA helicase RecQ n=1 Tax=Adhaeretor mobilis TaxID=1930276 RepID=A0A517MSG7_9BACT|nr:ATP-dependent DNA helicase RecQ [Adhaeretor mobilis]QDS97825.1 ATP-dependent DNA helicase RecQ [Adhaeretor mobilis]
MSATLEAAPVSNSTQLPAAAQSQLEEVFGFSEVRPGQAEVIAALLEGRSSLAIFPTGGGKSLCYQLPALLLDGLTLVVSPLIALMKDQIDFLQAKGIAAARLDSSLTREENLQVFSDLQSGKTRLLYVSPERLGNERFMAMLGRLKLALLAVDEAHCISAWGHNFRPDYLRIASLAKKLEIPRVLALTATATPEVAADIVEAFGIAQADAVKTGFYRPNLSLHAAPCEDEKRKRTLVERLKERPAEPAIVYVTLQKTAEQTAAYLTSAGLNARAYHAGMKSEKRNEIQEEFMAAEDMIVVATIAFGMGIDKANIRAVYHYNLPKGLESYMQEIGRAGRDGQPAHCELLACADDVITLENFSYGDTPTAEAVASLVDAVLDQGETIELSLYRLSREHDVRDLVIKTLLTYLELEGILQPTGAIYTEYKFKPQRSSAEILEQFDEGRAKFIADIFRQSRKASTWLTIDVAQASVNLNQPRERIVAALDYLDGRGDLILQTAGVRHGFRLLKHPDDRRELIETLNERFLQREEQDITRIRTVIDLVESAGCLTQTLLDYFGEERGPCGHCDRCLGAVAQPLPATAVTLSGSDRQVIARVAKERHDALRSPRQLTRFLCGVASPAASQAKLRSHKDFAALERVPFGEVLAAAEQQV